jgi:hypothetical protein
VMHGSGIHSRPNFAQNYNRGGGLCSKFHVQTRVELANN